MHRQRLDGVRAAAGVETTARGQGGGDPALVPVQQGEQRPYRRPGGGAHADRPEDRAPRRDRAERSPASRSSASTDDGASAAGGNARTTSRAPAGRSSSRSRTRWRSRRATRCRTTDPPTARLTTNPARGRGSVGSGAVGRSRCTTSRGRPPRRPRRMVEANSSRRVSREPAGSTGAGGSGREPLAALTAATGEDRAPGPGAHPQPETVRTRAAAVVRLEGALALAHGRLSRSTARNDAGRRIALVLDVVRDGGAAAMPQPRRSRWSAVVLGGRSRDATVGGHG